MSAEGTVAIHQPNFLPWLGWFDKLARADTFVLLDHVQMSKTAGNWTNRVRILVHGKPHWLTVPILRSYSGVRAINQIEIDDSRPWRDKAIETIRVNYRRRAAFAEVFPALVDIINFPATLLVELNVHGAEVLAECLGLDAAGMVRSSTLELSGHRNDLLADAVRKVGGASYLTGDGAAGYLDESVFERSGIQVIHQSFHHPVYAQPGVDEFVPGLSIIDALFSCGFDGIAALLVDR